MNGSIKNSFFALRGLLSIAASLCKVPVCVMSACAALMGYLAYDPLHARTSLGAAMGVFLLSAGSAILNNVQDRRLDAAMERTVRRPLPSGRISPAACVVISIAALAAGMTLLALSSATPAAPAAGAIAVLLYNGLYTPMKRRTMAAFLPGVICGTLPPFIGWLAAGGSPVSARILFIMVMFGLWQAPHFWLILMAHGDDYRNSGIPSMLDIVRAPVLKMLIFIWAASFSLMLPLMLPLSLVHVTVTTIGILLITIITPVVFAAVLLLFPRKKGYLLLFHLINVSLLIITLLSIIDSLRYPMVSLLP